LPGRRFGDYIVHVAKQRRSAGSSFCLLFLAICTFPAAGALPLQYASLARLHRLERGPRYTGGPHPQHGLVAIEMRNYPCSVNRTQIAVTVRSQAGAPHREVALGFTREGVQHGSGHLQRAIVHIDLRIADHDFHAAALKRNAARIHGDFVAVGVADGDRLRVVIEQDLVFPMPSRSP